MEIVLVQAPPPCAVLMDPRIGGQINFSGGAKFSRCAQIIENGKINGHISLWGCNKLER
jgi:hypothetical protein